jgi:hypothetical protein
MAAVATQNPQDGRGPALTSGVTRRKLHVQEAGVQPAQRPHTGCTNATDFQDDRLIAQVHTAPLAGTRMTDRSRWRIICNRS